MKKIILMTIGLTLSACATQKKCASLERRENSIFNVQTCQVYLRNGLYLDQVSPNIAEKIKEGQNLKFNWVPAKTVGQALIPAHAEVEASEGD